MFKRTLSAMAVGAVLIAGSMTSAQALEITAGNYKIIFDNFDVGTVGYGNTAGIKCNTVAQCDAIPGLNKANGTASDTAGILSVASISNLNNGQDMYVRGTSSTLANGVVVGPYLTGVFSNLNDYFVQVVPGEEPGDLFTSTKSVGGNFSIFSNASNWTPANGPTGAGSDLDNLKYAGISAGSLFLTGNFAAGAVIKGDAVSSYTTTYNNLTIAGQGQGYLDFTGGVAYPFFNTNSTVNLNGGMNDAFLTVTYDNALNAAGQLGWDVKSSGQISGTIQNVPEPGSLALISLAMLGLGATTARRRSKKG